MGEKQYSSSWTEGGKTQNQETGAGQKTRAVFVCPCVCWCILVVGRRGCRKLLSRIARPRVIGSPFAGQRFIICNHIINKNIHARMMKQAARAGSYADRANKRAGVNNASPAKKATRRKPTGVTKTEYEKACRTTQSKFNDDDKKASHRDKRKEEKQRNNV